MASSKETSSPLSIGILASGSGTNFDAIVASIDDGRLHATIAILLCNRDSAAVVAKARARGIDVRVIRHGDHPSRERYDAELAGALEAAGVELVALAGFDRIVTGALLERFPNRVMNIHPALLPSFKGLDAQTAAADYGVKIAGCTVHFVDENVDHGPIIVQAAVPVSSTDDTERVQQRILTLEHQIYPWALRLYGEGRLHIEGRKVVIQKERSDENAALISPAIED